MVVFAASLSKISVFAERGKFPRLAMCVYDDSGNEWRNGFHYRIYDKLIEISEPISDLTRLEIGFSKLPFSSEWALLFSSTGGEMCRFRRSGNWVADIRRIGWLDDSRWTSNLLRLCEHSGLDIPVELGFWAGVCDLLPRGAKCC